MKSFASCLIFSFASFLASAAEPSFDWVSAGGGAKNDKTRAICFDTAGNVFMAGEMTGDGTFGNQQVKCAGGMDFVLTKLDAQGRFLWARNIGGSLTDRGYGVATDAVGNAYVTGHFQSTDALIDGKALANEGDYDIFVAKFDAAGKQVWVRTAGGKGYDYGHGIAVDTQGDVVVTGAFVGDAKFGAAIVKGEGRPIFCAKYDGSGTLKWVKASTGKSSGSGHGIGIDSANNIYIAGSVSGEGAFDEVPIKPAQGQNTLLVKLNPDGKALWARTTAGGGLHEIAVDALGRTWVAGMFKGKATVGPDAYQSSGETDNDGFLLHYNPAGDLQWSRAIQSPKTDYCLGVATDNKGTAFVTGEFSETASLAGKRMTSRGATDIFVAAVDASGDLQWAIQAGGDKGDNAYTMAYHPNGHLVIGGAFAAPAQFAGKQVASSQTSDLYGACIILP